MSYTVTVDNHNFTVDFTPVTYAATISQVGQQGLKGDKGDKGDTGALQNNITGAYLGDAFQLQPLLKEASLYADFRNQIYAKGDRSGMTAVDTFDNLFDFSRATIGYAYNAAGTLTEYAVDVPRFEHDPLTGARKGLLIETAQTNVVLGNEDIYGAQWANGDQNGTDTPHTFANGLPGLEISVTSNRHWWSQSLTLAAGQHTLAIYAEGVSGALTIAAYFTGEEAADSRISISGGDAPGWYTATFTLTASRSGTIRIGAGTTTNTTGAVTLRVGAVQCVPGPYAGSYIPTGATTATRAADLLEVKPAVVAGVVSATEGTVFVRFVPFVSSTAIPRVVTLYGGTFENRIQIDYTSTGSARFAVVVGGVTTQAPTFFGTLALGEENAIALMWGGGRVAASLNGAAVVEATGITLPSEFTGVQWFANVAKSANAAALPEEVGVFMVAKSDAQAQSLSS